jgi:AraC family transcriptional regulator, positive regulator of tynA and feaB
MAIAETAGTRPLARMSTAMQNDARKFEYFCDAICGVYVGVQPEQPADQVFNAEFAAYAMDERVVASITAPGHKAYRDRATIRAKPNDDLFLNFSAFSSHRAEHAGRSWNIPTATPFLLDNQQAFRLDFDQSRRMRLYSLRFPRVAIGRELSQHDMRQANLAISATPAGRQLSLQMQLMCKAVEAGNIMLADLMSRAVLGLLSVVTQELAGGREENHALENIKSVARSHIEDPEFGLAQLARIFRCSVRTLQSRFADGDESFSSWLLAERLELARLRLLSPIEGRQSIETVAFSCGFRDPSHFHRAFKQRFLVPPGATRR